MNNNRFVVTSGGTINMNTDLVLNSKKVTGLANPTTDSDAVNKFYVDNAISSIPAQSNSFTNLSVSDTLTVNNITGSGSILVPTATLSGQAINLQQLNDSLANYTLTTTLVSDYALKTDLSSFITASALNPYTTTADLEANYAAKVKSENISSTIGLPSSSYTSNTVLTSFSFNHTDGESKYMMTFLIGSLTGEMAKNTQANFQIVSNDGSTDTVIASLPLSEFLFNSNSTTEFFNISQTLSMIINNNVTIKIYLEINNSQNVTLATNDDIQYVAIPIAPSA